MTDDPRLQPYRVDVVGFDTALAELRSVRDEVFVGEQGVPITLEHDALDPLCTHVLARLLDGSPVGTARLTPDHHIGRMAVRAAWRGRGIGDALLRALLDEARRRGWPEVRLNSQAEADLSTFEARCRAWPLVRECHMLNGEIDFILKCVSPDLTTFQEFLTGELTAAENVASVKTSLVIRAAKDEPGVPFEVLEERLQRLA